MMIIVEQMMKDDLWTRIAGPHFIYDQSRARSVTRTLVQGSSYHAVTGKDRRWTLGWESFLSDDAGKTSMLDS
jgi:hypothetical protein